MPRHPKPTRPTAAEIEARIPARLASHGPQSARQLADWLREPVDRIRIALIALEHAGTIGARLETHDEAATRVSAMPKRPFVRHPARRAIVYLTTAPEQAA